jgi:hypothetical protein
MLKHRPAYPETLGEVTNGQIIGTVRVGDLETTHRDAWYSRL